MPADHHATGKPQPRHISAEHLKLALVARRLRPATRWAAMSNGAATSSCKHRSTAGYCVHQPPVLQPLTAGSMRSLFDRVRSQGRAEVLRTWRTSIAVLKAEFSSCVLRTAPGGA